MSSNKKIVVNGKEEKPIKKRKLPRDIDWQALAKKKQEAESPSSGND